VESVELVNYGWEFRVFRKSLLGKCWSLSTFPHNVCGILEIFRVPI
jgi:hypothetical protein